MNQTDSGHKWTVDTDLEIELYTKESDEGNIWFTENDLRQMLEAIEQAKENQP